MLKTNDYLHHPTPLEIRLYLLDEEDENGNPYMEYYIDFHYDGTCHDDCTVLGKKCVPGQETTVTTAELRRLGYESDTETSDEENDSSDADNESSGEENENAGEEDENSDEDGKSDEEDPEEGVV